MREDLIKILPEWHSTPQPVYLLTETRLLPAKIQKFIDFLKEKLAEKDYLADKNK